MEGFDTEIRNILSASQRRRSCRVANQYLDFGIDAHMRSDWHTDEQCAEALRRRQLLLGPVCLRLSDHQELDSERRSNWRGNPLPYRCTICHSVANNSINIAYHFARDALMAEL